MENPGQARKREGKFNGSFHWIINIMLIMQHCYTGCLDTCDNAGNEAKGILPFAKIQFSVADHDFNFELMANFL